MDNLEAMRANIEECKERAERFEQTAAHYRAETVRLEEELVAAIPPFQVGDLVKPKQWAFPCHWEVRGCARIAGEWVVLLGKDGEAIGAYVAGDLKLDPKPPFPSAGQRWHRKQDGGKPERNDNHGTIISVDGDDVEVKYGDGSRLTVSKERVLERFEEAA